MYMYAYNIQALVVRAEDSRILGDMRALRKAYTSLDALNLQLLQQHASRHQTQAQLVEALKAVNMMIQRAASLRTGTEQHAIIYHYMLCTINHACTACHAHTTLVLSNPNHQPLLYCIYIQVRARLVSCLSADRR